MFILAIKNNIYKRAAAQLHHFRNELCLRKRQKHCDALISYAGSGALHLPHERLLQSSSNRKLEVVFLFYFYYIANICKGLLMKQAL